MAPLLLVVLSLLGAATAQQAGTLHAEAGPKVALRQCTKAGGCRSAPAPVTLDANWRWVHTASGYQNCYQGASWDDSLCPDGKTCAEGCALEGVTADEYRGTYGVTAAAGGVELKFVSKTQYGDNVGSRLYLLDGDADDEYKVFKLKNREFTMDVDVSNLPCGLNGAVYFVEMDARGGLGAGNRAGAKYGTGYCDAQCPHDIKFIGGEANVLEWNATAVPPVGRYGTCCAEMDIWEANSRATAYTAHPCTIKGQQSCDGVTCGDTAKGERYQGVCDKDGCDYNAYRMGDRGFFGVGPNFTVDTSKPVTVVTQFLTADGTDHGDLTEIRRLYVQGGKVVPNSESTFSGAKAGNSITDAFCAKQKGAFSDPSDFKAKGALKAMGQALDRGMVLTLSLWDDTLVNMLWLDSAYPTSTPKSAPGVARGPCPGGHSSTPEYLRSTYPDASVTYSNLAVGEIGSTFASGRRLGARFV